MNAPIPYKYLARHKIIFRRVRPLQMVQSTSNVKGANDGDYGQTESIGFSYLCSCIITDRHLRCNREEADTNNHSFWEGSLKFPQPIYGRYTNKTVH